MKIKKYEKNFTIRIDQETQGYIDQLKTRINISELLREVIEEQAKKICIVDKPVK